LLCVKFDDTLAEMSGQPQVAHVNIPMSTKNRSKKDKRHSGRYTPRIETPMMKWNEMKISACTPEEAYDDWIERRDGFRDTIYLKWKIRDKAKSKKKSH